MGVALCEGIAFFGKCPLCFCTYTWCYSLCQSECPHLARGYPVPVGQIPAIASDAKVEAALGLCCGICAQGAAAQPQCLTGTHLVQLQAGASVTEGLDNRFDFLPHSSVLLSVDFLSVEEPRK